jgi:murein DD-endopeptidase MepM/ murein hydrolase activator NlpD
VSRLFPAVILVSRHSRERGNPGLAIIGLMALLIALPARADTLTLHGNLEEGALIRGRVDPGAKVTLDGRPVRVAADGAFIFGFSRNAPAQAALDVAYPDGGHARRELAVAARRYLVQRINGLPKNEVSPNPATLSRIFRDIAAVRAAHRVDSSLRDFETPLAWPVTGPITGVFGSQRILDGRPRAPHAGIDIAAPAGTPVKAPAGGIVTLAAADFVLDGGIVVIDHGYGLSTLYIHLSHIAVHRGEKVRQGEIIGRVGATGRATGPNLHWGVYWYETALDPALAAGPMPVAVK